MPATGISDYFVFNPLPVNKADTMPATAVTDYFVFNPLPVKKRKNM